MKDQPVVQFPEKRLHQPSEPVTDFDDSAFQLLVESMVLTMRKQRGIGLAAPQIGVWKQIAVIEMKDGPLVVINPTITHMSNDQEDDEEGCLSVKGVYCIVPRAKRLTLSAQDVHGEPYTLKASGLLARVIQHEYDHLQGMLIVDRCTKLTAGIEKARALGVRIPSA